MCRCTADCNHSHPKENENNKTAPRLCVEIILGEALFQRTRFFRAKIIQGQVWDFVPSPALVFVYR